MKVKLDDKFVTKARPPEGQRQIIFWDEDRAGFGLRVTLSAKRGKLTRSYVVQYDDANDKQRLVTLGEHGTLGLPGTMTLPKAREEYKATLGRIAEGKPTDADLERLRKSGPTVGEAFLEYLASMERGCTAQSIRNTRRVINGSYFLDWMDLPLRSITAAMCRAKLAKIGEKAPEMANSAMRKFQHMWRYISRERRIDDPTWPAGEPTEALHGLWFTGTPHRPNIPWSKLPTWWENIHDVEQMSVDIRDYNILCLLTGLRRESACTLRWDYINLEDVAVEMTVPRGDGVFEDITVPPHAMFLPFPKGGADNAYMIPLSQFVVDMLRRRREENAKLEWRRGKHKRGGGAVHAVGDAGWVFPGLSTGNGAPCAMCAELGLPAQHPVYGVCHLVKPTLDDNETFPSPHALRRTFKTAMVEAGLAEIDQDVLMNHKWASGNHKRIYVKQNFPHLMKCQEATTEYILKMADVITSSPTDLRRQHAELERKLAELRAQITNAEAELKAAA